jgi:tetratricopeptide (TPR) repeat protein
MFPAMLCFVFGSLWAALAVAEDNTALNAAMRHNFDSLMELQPLVADESAFRDEKNKKKIEDGLRSLSDVASALGPLVDQAKKPNLKAISLIFSDYIKSAESNFKAGHKDYVRLQLRSMTGLCASCHTRSERVKPFTAGDDRILGSSLSDLQKAQYFSAIRQYDRALEFYEKALESTTYDSGILDLVHVVHGYLNVSVRVKQDPLSTIGFLTKVENKKGVAEYFSRDLQQWKSDLTAWTKEKKAKGSAVTTAKLLSSGRMHVARAQKIQMYPADHAADISYLRATNDLHQVLERDLSKQQRAEAYFLLGVSYNALAEPVLSELDTLYFEACISELPHSTQARQCFKRLAANIYLGYSGSAGTSIPRDEVERLSRLRKQAF